MPPVKQPQQPAGTGKQTPIEQTPDNPQFQSHENEVKEALKLVEGGAPTKKEENKKVTEPPAEGQSPAPTEPPLEERTGPTAKGWAAITKAEKKLQEERERLAFETKTKQNELAQLRQQVDAARAETTNLREAFKKDPFGTLKRDLGLSFNDLANLALEDDPTAKLNAFVQDKSDGDPMVKKLLEKIEGLEKTMNGQTVQRELDSYRNDIKRAVADDSPLSILTTMPNLDNEVLNLAGEYYKRTGERLSADKACGILAKYWEQHLKTLGSHAAARRVLGLPDPEANGTQKKPAPRGPTKTLTNRQLASPSGDGKIPDNLSEEEELRLAAKLVIDDVQ